MKLFTKWIVLALVNLWFLMPADAQHSKKRHFKIVGYYSLRAAMTDSLNTVPFNQLTHVNLWFLNPDSTGQFTQDLSLLSPFVDAAHAQQVKVLASIGGGSPHPYYHSLLKDEVRKSFVDKLVALTELSGLDGLDVDLEGNDIDDNYEKFVTELATALHAHNKIITAAIAVYYKYMLSVKALSQYDFVNVMSYDRTGPWRPEKPGPHSTYADAAEDLNYFATEKKIPKEKMTLGVPFYGYGFGPDSSSTAISMNYGEIVASFPGAELSDEVKAADGKTIYYNGVETIKQKTALAREKASGIMIWQIKGDAPGKQSLLTAIYDAGVKKK